MEEIRESKTISNNTNGQRVHECIKYERDELIGIAHKCKQDNRYKILNKKTCVKIRDYRLNEDTKEEGRYLKLHTGN